jgi:hypothetical protein
VIEGVTVYDPLGTSVKVNLPSPSVVVVFTGTVLNFTVNVGRLPLGPPHTFKLILPVTVEPLANAAVVETNTRQTGSDTASQRMKIRMLCILLFPPGNVHCPLLEATKRLGGESRGNPRRR